VDARLSAWAPLRHKIFFALFVAQLASNIGTLMQSVGSAWLMGDLGGSPALVALVQTATFLPVLIVGIPAGALADIVDRRKLLVATQASMMVAAFLLTVLAFLDKVTPGSLLTLTFLLGLGTGLNGPAWQAIQPDLVPKRELSQALALGALTFNVGRAIGPALGGLILAALGPAWVFAVNAVSFLGTVLVLLGWRPAKLVSALPAETLTGATRAGLRYGIYSPLLRAVLLRVAVLMFPAAAIQALLPTVVRDSLGLSSGAYGLLLACFGIGAASAALVRPRLEERYTRDQLVVGSSALLALGLIVDALVPIAWIVGLGLYVAGTGWTTAFTTTNVSAQSMLPQWVRARGMGLYMLVLTGCVALGSAVWGVVADVNLVLAHLVAAGLVGVGVLAGRYYPLDATQTIDTTPVPGVDPTIVVTPRPDDGPVLVTVVHRVPPDQAADFRDTMRIIERHRRRTGAYRWNLYRDLADPDRYLESFVVDSWAEHLRQHQRTTVGADARLDEARRFHEAGVAVTHYVSAYSPGAIDLVDVELPTTTEPV